MHRSMKPLAQRLHHLLIHFSLSCEAPRDKLVKFQTLPCASRGVQGAHAAPQVWLLPCPAQTVAPPAVLQQEAGLGSPLPVLAACPPWSFSLAPAVSMAGIPFLSALSITSALCRVGLVLPGPAPDKPKETLTGTHFPRCCFVQGCVYFWLFTWLP